ncbi:uncharacterized protein LACBIDRAFT_314439 [Laccaria bicolor S238N-H82]|uniref:Predicted protein n=1 Tax=Laccaria bicolor (strain S238N-H82 / ATCC MYA-4686) TaxID=486041 RepID=B0DYJ9_LACBS|nr:uncharacterized protein LACBIDRAFT_314439 [Laccaria bicolor S238N-H82]EDR00258.1 predicted protein [Laccaria bicolor S238N-H82]|eukprot:XP_001889010.1 predicted protein [Laccaria bicolor S238N-H82]
MHPVMTGLAFRFSPPSAPFILSPQPAQRHPQAFPCSESLHSRGRASSDTDWTSLPGRKAPGFRPSLRFAHWPFSL